MTYENWTILIVEDDPDHVEVITEIFHHHGVATYVTFNAEEGLQMLEEVYPTLLVVDLALPGMDGWEFLSTIQNNPHLAAIPAVAITAFYSANVAQEALEAGFEACFPKPLRTGAFIQDLAAIVEAR